MPSYAEQVAAEYAAMGLNPDGTPKAIPPPPAPPLLPSTQHILDVTGTQPPAPLLPSTQQILDLTRPPEPERRVMGTSAPDFGQSIDEDRKAEQRAYIDDQDKAVTAELNAQRDKAIEEKLAREKSAHGQRFGRIAQGPGQVALDDFDPAAERRQIASTGLTSSEKDGIHVWPQTAAELPPDATGPGALPEHLRAALAKMKEDAEGKPARDAVFAGGPQKPAAAAGSAGGGGAGSYQFGAKVSGLVPGAGEGGAGDFDEPYNMARDAYEQKGQAESDIALAQGDAAKQRMIASDKAAADMQRAQDLYEKLSSEHYAKLEALNREVAEGTVDPDRWWNNQGTGRQILYVIGAALGGFASGYRPGTPNSALAILQHKIDNDIDAQKANLAQKGHAAEGEKGLLAEAYQRTHSLEEASLMAKQAAYDHVANQVAEITAGSNSQIAKANAQVFMAGLDEKRQENREKVDEFHQSLAAKEMMAMLRKGRGAGGGASDKEVDALRKELDARNIPATEQALNAAKAEVESGKGAGLGRATHFLAKHIGDWFLSDKGKDTNLALEAAAGEAAKGMGRFGGASYGFAKDLLTSGDPVKVKKGLQLLGQKVSDEKRSIYSGHRPEVAQVYEQRYGAYGGGGGADDDDLPPGVGAVGDE